MYLKFYILSLVKVGLLVALPPYLAGLFSTLAYPKTAPKLTKYYGIIFVLIIELIVLIEKGSPFFFANLYFMFSLSPNEYLQYAIGIGGFIMWMFFAVNMAENGVDRGLKLRSVFGGDE